MQSKQTTPADQQEKTRLILLPPKKLADGGLRRALSDFPTEIDQIIRDLDVQTSMKINEEEEELVEYCACCGMSEECTPTYIGRVKEFFCGKWVCGLCTEALKEQTRRFPSITIEEALESHTALCKKFNGTTRLNPKLSLAGSMRDIVRRSSQINKDTKKGMVTSSKIARTSSCGPRINLKFGRSTIQ